LNKGQSGDLSNSAVRLAVPADAQALTGLRDAFWRDQIAKGTLDSPDLAPARLSADTAKLVERARTVLLVVVREGAIGGYLYAQVKMVPGTPPVGSVEEIFVNPQCRRANLAHALVKSAVAELQAVGAGRIQLRVLQDNAEGRQFWQRLGFAPSVTIYEYRQNPTQQIPN
jgi:ribosomal protein S18 acetylase RimI-like enzyme